MCTAGCVGDGERRYIIACSINDTTEEVVTAGGSEIVPNTRGKSVDVGRVDGRHICVGGRVSRT